MLDGENTKKSKEVEDLQARVADDEQRDEEARRESFGLKQKIVATEASKEQALKEVKAQIKSLLHSLYHAVVCNKWRGPPPWRNSSEETSQRWRPVGDIASDLP